MPPRPGRRAVPAEVTGGNAQLRASLIEASPVLRQVIGAFRKYATWSLPGWLASCRRRRSVGIVHKLTIQLTQRSVVGSCVTRAAARRFDTAVDRVRTVAATAGQTAAWGPSPLGVHSDPCVPAAGWAPADVRGDADCQTDPDAVRNSRERDQQAAGRAEGVSYPCGDLNGHACRDS